MFEKIISFAQTTDYDFRQTACPRDPLRYLFAEWVGYYKMKWAISHQLKPASILEIGVRFGYSAAAFLHGHPEARYLGIDFDTDSYGGTKGAIKWAKKITRQFPADFIIGDSQAFDRLPGGVYDLIHIDGQQDGDATFHDLELAIKQARYVLVDGYLWSPLNFAAVNEFLFRYRDHFDFCGMIPGYGGELLVKVSDDVLKVGGDERGNGVLSSVDICPAYTVEYYLRDCAGFDVYKESGGKELIDPRLQAIASIASLKDNGRALDIGCGRGELTYYLAKRGFAVTAVDYSADAIALAEKCFDGEEELRSRVEFIQGDVSKMQFQRQYDLVTASDVVEHLSPEELELLYKGVSAHLKPAGLFVVHTFPNLWYYKFGYPRRRRIAASVGAYLPAQPRSRYEMLMHINEQSPRVLKRQLTRNFQHVLVWFGDPHNPGGSLLETFGRDKLRTTEGLFSVASNSPIKKEQLKAVFQMKPLPALPSGEIKLAVREYPESVHAGTLFNLALEIENNSAFMLTSRPPHPVHIAYHWLDEMTSEPIVFEGQRSMLLPPLKPGSTELYNARVKAPERTGYLVLRTTLVQEGIRWLDQAPTMILAEVRIACEGLA
jgi:SAM-dependent methyltransferase